MAEGTGDAGNGGAAAGGTDGGVGAGGTGGTDSGTGGAAGGAPAPAWHGLSDPADVGYIQNKGWQNPQDVIKSYRGAEKLIGKPVDRLAEIPMDGDEAGWNNFYTKLGRPETPDKYNLMVGAPDGSKPDPEVTSHISGLFHKAGLTAKQAEAVAGGYNQLVAQRAEQEMKDYSLNLQADKDSLQQEWRGGYDRKFNTAQMAARSLDIPQDAINGIEAEIGYANTIKLFAAIGEKLGEHKFVGGEGGGARFDSQLTPQEAAAQIEQMNLDPNVRAALTNRDHPAHKATVAKRSKLFGIAYPTE